MPFPDPGAAVVGRDRRCAQDGLHQRGAALRTKVACERAHDRGIALARDRVLDKMRR
jgi:hypothetical protein